MSRLNVSPSNVVPAVEPLLVTVKQAAKLLSISKYALRRLVQQGLLPYRRIGSRWLIPTKALRTFADPQ